MVLKLALVIGADGGSVLPAAAAPNVVMAPSNGFYEKQWRERQLRYHETFVPGRLQINSPRINDLITLEDKFYCTGINATAGAAPKVPQPLLRIIHPYPRISDQRVLHQRCHHHFTHHLSYHLVDVHGERGVPDILTLLLEFVLAELT